MSASGARPVRLAGAPVVFTKRFVRFVPSRDKWAIPEEPGPISRVLVGVGSGIMRGMTDVVARQVVVRGRVQGVFFRATCRDEALLRGVTGWARNEPDGSVRAHLEGPAGAVEDVVEWCRRGPRHAVVDSVDVTVATATGAPGFDVR
jgi:acylphosphatase